MFKTIAQENTLELKKNLNLHSGNSDWAPWKIHQEQLIPRSILMKLLDFKD